MLNALDNAGEWARDWWFGAALPLWWSVGADRQHGGFFEQIDQSGAATAANKRCRVQGRQAFVYAEAGRLGWDGPWQDAIEHALSFLRTAYRRDDGLFRKTVAVDGSVVDDDVDLYDQAFVLLGLVSGYKALGQPQALRDEAAGLVERLATRLKHPRAGFEEASPRRLPLRSNPHMHLLEALLAWTEAGGGDVFEAHARDIVRLATTRFLDPQTGAVGEYFDGDWQFMPGDKGAVREPGHQFEWAFLLTEADRILGGDHREQIARLADFGTRFGVDVAREVAVFSTDAAGRVTDPDARLWSQTERLRTGLVLAAHAEGADAERHRGEAAKALTTLRRFLDVPVAGLWRDRMRPDGAIVDEPAPASSFYHIVTGIVPLIEGVRR